MTEAAIAPRAAEAVRALARLRSFRAAAETEGMSQASFSGRITQAETYVGMPLFERHRSGATLTTAGRDLLEFLRTLGMAEGHFRGGVARLREARGGRITIGAGPLTIRAIVVPVLRSLLEALPRVQIRILVRADDEPLEGLRRGTIDITICELTHTANLSDLDLKGIRKRTVCFWARPEHPIHTRGAVPKADVLHDLFVSPFLHTHWRRTAATLLP